jgi:hypothetical protein
VGLPKGLITGVSAKLPGSFQGFVDAPAARPAKRKRRKPDKPQRLPPLPEELVVLRLAVRVPPINPVLLPNRARGVHWAEKGRIAKSLRRRTADEAAVARMRAGMRGAWKRATLQIVAVYPTRRHPDPDNLIAALKPAIDGLADGGVFANDRELKIFPPRIIKGLEPGILLVLEKI